MPDLLAALDAFLLGIGGLDRERVWLTCSCGAQIGHPVARGPYAPVALGP
jgi:hypothetical protein